MKKNKINVDLLLKNERSTIDRLDAIIINALIERFSVTKRIGLIKAEIPLFDERMTGLPSSMDLKIE